MFTDAQHTPLPDLTEPTTAEAVVDTVAETVAATVAETVADADLAQGGCSNTTHPSPSDESALADEQVAQQEALQAAYEAHRQAWETAMAQQKADGTDLIRRQLGDAVDQPTAESLYDRAHGNIVDAIAMHLNASYAAKVEARLAQEQQQYEKDDRDIRECNLRCDPHTAIRRMRAVANLKDSRMQARIKQDKQAQQARNDADDSSNANASA